MKHDLALQWLFTADAARSSITLCAALFGIRYVYADTPQDTYTFAQCLNLCQTSLVSKDDLRRVPDISPEWGAFIENWEELLKLYKKGMFLELDDKIKELRCEKKASK